MNKITYLVNTIKRDIPKEILNMTFIPQFSLTTLKPSLDFLIKKAIILDWVAIDCNVVAGIEALIDITNTTRDAIANGTIIHVGYGPTGGKVITSVLSVGYGFNCISGGAAGIVSALTEPLLTSDSRIELVGNNIVYVEGYVGIQLTNMRVVLENDVEFNNIHVRSMFILADLCVLAAKAYIYKEMNIRLGTGVIVNGIDMGKITSIVESYSDANTMYREKLNAEWFKTAFMSDRVSMNRHIRRMMPG